MENGYWRGYQLDTKLDWELTERDELVLSAGLYIYDNKCSIRQTAKEFSLSKSSLHRMIHNELSYLSTELYLCVLKVIELKKTNHYN